MADPVNAMENPNYINNSIHIFNIIIYFFINLIKNGTTVFRQAFLLIQYSFICKQYFFCSDREYQYFVDRC